jgi:hypothetical protein
VAVSGQDQDQETGVYATRREKELELDLRDVASKGMNLRGDHCRGFRQFQTLIHVLAEHDQRRSDNMQLSTNLSPQASNLNPTAVSRAVQWAINAVRTPDDSIQSKHYAEVRNRLFGFSAETRGPTRRDRRAEVALEYYNVNLADFVSNRRFPVGLDNFVKNVYQDELLPPLVEVLLRREMELKHSSPHLTFGDAVASISRGWGQPFGFLFDLEQHTSKILDLEQAREVLLPPLPDGSTPQVVDVEYKIVLHEMAIILRLTRLGWSFSDELRSSQWVEQIIEVAERFFRRRDAEWLDEALGDRLSEPTVENTIERFYQFIDLLEQDAAGRLALQRFRRTVDRCPCPRTDKICFKHHFLFPARMLQKHVMLDWFYLGMMAARRIQPSDVPPRIIGN